MSSQTQAIATDAVRRNCPKCGWIRDTAETKCVDCGKTLQSVAKIKGLGVFQVILGTLLIGIMGWLSLWMYNAVSAPKNGSSTRFTGGPEDIGLIAFVFGLVIIIGLTSVVGGLWQIIFGKRNKVVVAMALILGLVFMGTALSITLNK